MNEKEKKKKQTIKIMNTWTLLGLPLSAWILHVPMVPIGHLYQ